MEPREAAIWFWLGPIAPEEMPMLAARMLASGHDTPALRRAAGCSRRDDPRDVREEFVRALDELGVWLPSHDDAELVLGVSLARSLLGGELTIAGCARRVLDVWHLDDAIYPGLPDHLKDLVLMCFLLDTEHYAESGGDDRLMAAARALAARGH